jgi:hypothetical protein
VATEDNNDSTTCVGLGIDVGARFETKEEQGMSALLKRMLLSGRFSQRLEQLGASLIRSDVSCKDSIYVAAEVLRPHAKVRQRFFLFASFCAPPRWAACVSLGRRPSIACARFSNFFFVFFFVLFIKT